MSKQLHFWPKNTVIRKKFRDFHGRHPEVYAELERLALKAKHSGWKVGIGCLYEVMRWNYWIRQDAVDDFKLSNNHRAYYSRLIMENNPDELGDFFVLRPVTGGEAETEDED